MRLLLELLPDINRAVASLCVNVGVVVLVHAVAVLFPLSPGERWAAVAVFLSGVVVAAHPAWTRRGGA